jgi:DNA-binding GntR family transcriptional regulator
MLARDAYERLKHAIYTGKLNPGGRIVERDLARRFRISRIPLRESLARLQAEGLIRSIPYSSSYVEDFEPVDILEIYSMRLIFEPLAARLAAARAGTRLIKRLEGYAVRMTRLAQRTSPLALDRTDYAFHHAIVEASGHRRLLRAYEGTHIRIVSLRPRDPSTVKPPPEQILREHTRIINCLRKHDAEGAELASRQHVARSLRMLESSLGATLDSISRAPRKTR